mmetsp:Transcript_112791/g.299636  ORF Transcript_112791/g.299636 Transcript_112791/m.299636 type:complete len:303 (+) Transcript_112791:277-1185(+)
MPTARHRSHGLLPEGGVHQAVAGSCAAWDGSSGAQRWLRAAAREGFCCVRAGEGRRRGAAGAGRPRLPGEPGAVRGLRCPCGPERRAGQGCRLQQRSHRGHRGDPHQPPGGSQLHAHRLQRPQREGAPQDGQGEGHRRQRLLREGGHHRAPAERSHQGDAADEDAGAGRSGQKSEVGFCQLFEDVLGQRSKGVERAEQVQRIVHLRREGVLSRLEGGERAAACQGAGQPRRPLALEGRAPLALVQPELERPRPAVLRLLPRLQRHPSARGGDVDRPAAGSLLREQRRDLAGWQAPCVDGQAV